MGLKVPTFVSRGWFPWQPVPILWFSRGFPKLIFFTVNSGVVERGLLGKTKHLPHSGVFQGTKGVPLGPLCWVPQTKTIIYITAATGH